MKFQVGQWVRLSPKYPTPARQGEQVVVTEILPADEVYGYMVEGSWGEFPVWEEELEEIPSAPK